MNPEAEAMEPETGRALWRQLLAVQNTDPQASLCLQLVIESVIVDLIQNQIDRDDTFAKVIGARIQRLRSKGSALTL